MRFARPNILSYLLAGIIAVLFLASFIIVSMAGYGHIQWLTALVTTTVILFATFFSVKIALEKFIYEKIRPIYKTIFNLKAPKGKENKVAEQSSDIISNVNREVLQWVADNREEIQNLKKMEAYRREFLGNVSHELRTPIFNIQGYILTLLDGGLEDKKINREYLIRTEKSIDRMIAIVQDLDTISKLETGELVPVKARFDIIALVKEVFEFLEIKAEKRGIRFNFASNTEKSLYVNADIEKIRQVLINLIENSIKYGTDNGHTKVSFFDMDENILIEVTDNGIGVAKQDIPRLFERFFRTDKGRSREQGGTGLGLAIVKHIIEAHDQTINVRSTPGVGTTFAFTLKKG